MSDEIPEGEIIELTPRELAICRGEDPDAVEPDKTPAAGQDVESESAPSGDKEVAEPAHVDAEWVDSDVLALAKSYGLDADEVSAFKDSDEFLRAAALFDKRALSESRVAPVPAPQAAPVDDTVSDDIDPQKYIDAGYDEQTVALVKHTKRLADELAAMKAESQQQRQTAVVAAEQDRLWSYHDAVDTLDEKRYGRSLDAEGNVIPLKKDADENRRKLHDTAQVLMAKAPANTPLSVILKRAEKIAFAEELLADERRSYQDKVARQSAKRRPAAGRARSTEVRSEEVDDVTAIANSPEMVRLWKKIQEENGS